MTEQRSTAVPDPQPKRSSPREAKAAQDLRNKALPPLDNRATGERSTK